MKETTDDSVEVLAARLGHRFADPKLLLTALTHPSFAHEADAQEDYERLEFLGDAVLGLVTAEWLYAEEPEAREGVLARRKSYLVSAPVLASAALELGVDEALRVGAGEELSGGRRKQRLLADSMEALLGALYLDAGLAGARAVVVSMLESADDHQALELQDAKTRLQEWLQGRGRPLPTYRITAEEGPPHDRRFECECHAGALGSATAQARTKKEAERLAAFQMLERIESSETSESG